MYSLGEMMPSPLRSGLVSRCPMTCFTLGKASCRDFTSRMRAVRCASVRVVGGAAFLVQSADVADADGTLVPAHTMRPVEGDVSSRFDGAVEADDVMIADGPEATGTVPAVDIGSGDVLSRTGGGTVDDDGVFHCRNSFLCPLSLGNI